MKYNIKYTSEYIPKLQIHQHSLFTRKVFSWHNWSAQVFFSGSNLDHHQRWIITRSSSKLDHHWIIIKAGSSLDQHQFWIITGSTSSLDHHWINIKSRSSLDHHHHYFVYLNQRCYLSILLIIGSSTEPTLFHVGCRPSIHVGLYLQSNPFLYCM